MSEPAASPGRINLGIISIVCFNFASYVCNGLPLAVLPGYVLNDLNLSPVFAGLVIGVQYMATLLSRPLGGQLADRWGSKRVVLYGLGGLVLSGVLTSLAIFLHAPLWIGTGLIQRGAWCWACLLRWYRRRAAPGPSVCTAPRTRPA